MPEGNFYKSFSGRSISLMELLIVCILMSFEVSLQADLHYEPVAYEDVLKSRVQEIQSDIKETNDHDYLRLSCDHYPIHIGSFTKTVVFVWASARETHDMQSCLYREMTITGKQFSEYFVVFGLLYNSYFNNQILQVDFCNRSMEMAVMVEEVNKIQVIGLSLFSSVKNDGMMMLIPFMQRINLGIPTLRSQIHFIYVDSQPQTCVCSSIQLTSEKTDKLRQRFFSVVGSSPEVIAKSFRTGSTSVTLDFNVVTLNTSRLGLLNGSVTELLSLSDLQVSCIKLDQYGLNSEVNEILYTNVTEELSMTTKSLLINDKLWLRVNVSIPVVSDHCFGEYACATYCRLQTKNSNETIYGCEQVKYFSIVSQDWRTENLFFRRQHKYCMKNMSSIAEGCVRSIKIWNETTNYCVREYQNAKSELVSSQILLIIFAVPVIVKLVKYIEQRVRTDIDLKAFTSLESVLQLTEHSDNRNLKYDVFLSYSSKDRLWVQSKLLKFIESKGFKVCYDERDFPYGCNLVETIGRAVYESRNVIAVVSPDYLKSRWCAQYKFVLTYTKILNKEAPYNSLLLIKYRYCQMPEHMNCLKYLDYTTVVDACDNDRSLLEILLSTLCLCKEPDVIERSREAQFFDALLSWLGEPHIG